MSEYKYSVPAKRKFRVEFVYTGGIFGFVIGWIIAVIVGNPMGFVVFFDHPWLSWVILFSPTVVGTMIGYALERKRSKIPFWYGVNKFPDKWPPKKLSPEKLKSAAYVYKLIAQAYIDTGRIFSGMISQFIKIAEDDRKKEAFVQKGFTTLVALGLLLTEEDEFWPTDMFFLA